jgi:LAS seventeen-binding protein 5
MVLASWHSQFKDDPGMSYVANLYKPPPRPRSQQVDNFAEERRKREEAERKRKAEEEEARQRAKEEKDAKERERWRKADEERAAKKAAKEKEKEKDKNKGKQPRRRFNYETEKPSILAAIATASQCSSNLVNAITVRGYVSYAANLD